MTPATDRNEADLRAIRNLIQKDGERWTAQRRLIISMLLTSHEHPTAEELTARAKRADPAVAQTTIYRTLALLNGIGVVRRILMEHGPARYEITLGRRAHHHLIDVVHQTVLEVDCPELDALLETIAHKHGRTLLSRSLDIFVRPESDCRSA